MAIPVYILGAALVCFVGWVVYDQIRLRRRRGPSRDEFAEAFRGDGVSYKLAAAVYDYYSAIAVGRGYALHPDDTYDGVLLEGPDDIEADAEQLLKRLQIRLPDEPARRNWSSPPKSVREMVLWLNSVKQHQNTR